MYKSSSSGAMPLVDHTELMAKAGEAVFGDLRKAAKEQLKAAKKQKKALKKGRGRSASDSSSSTRARSDFDASKAFLKLSKSAR